MADSTSVFQFQDPFQSTDYSSSFFLDNQTLAPSEIALNNEQITSNFEDDQEWDRFLDSEDPLSDPVIWAFCNDDDDDVIRNSQPAPSGFPEQGCSSHGISDNLPETPGFGDRTMSLSFPLPAPQSNCVCCQILREITHTNGINVKRLEIHGALGVITHVVLGIYDYDTSFQTQDLQMFDFHKEGAQTVKKFLVQYFDVCRQDGFVPIQDPLSTFYEALSVGLKEPDNMNEFLPLLPENTGDYHFNQDEATRLPEGGRSKQGESVKIPLSMQRERTRKLKLKDFVEYFHLPIEEAARKMNLCPTVMKKICRRHGVPRWPHRKVKSIEKKLSKLGQTADAGDNEERLRAQADIQKYKQELANIYEPFTK